MAPNPKIVESSRPDPEFEQACSPNLPGFKSAVNRSNGETNVCFEVEGRKQSKFFAASQQSLRRKAPDCDKCPQSQST
ncbi:hypothetical protein N7450_010349 [Penicillium hetheringtonii]|uniref:Uncharacterized protein n=1 Tax=Penicillium hetheringtonii TaxID=911720 RepID=A0AAD6D842_9EURO|nr:hypothetical protein N7450_010349 [Penicillium hetheringtonii]